MPYHIFISYRREGGSEVVRGVQGALRDRGLRVFLDVDELRTGHFDEALLRHIAESPNFLVVLTPGSLDRSLEHEEDWLGQEIRQAIRTGSNIVPVLMPGFSFPPEDRMPEDLRPLCRHNGVNYSHDFYEAMIERIVEMLDLPDAAKNGAEKTSNRSGIPVASRSLLLWGPAGLGVAIVLAFALVQLLNRDTSVSSPPVTETQALAPETENLLKALADDLFLKTGVMDTELGHIQETHRKAQNFIEDWQLDPDHPPESGELVDWLDLRLERLGQLAFPNPWDRSLIPILAQTPVEAGDLSVFYESMFPQYLQETRNYYAQLREFAAASQGLWLEDPDRWLELETASQTEMSHLLYYGVWNILARFPEPLQQEFSGRQHELMHLPTEYSMTREEAESKAKKALNRLRNSTHELATLLGEENRSLLVMESEYDERARKLQKNETLRRAITQKEALLMESQTKALEQFRVQPGDSWEKAWMKLNLFTAIDMEDPAREALDHFAAASDGFPGKDRLVQATRAYIAQREDLGLAGGVIIRGMDNNAAHSSLRVGDILIMINNEPVIAGSDYARLKTTAQQENPEEPLDFTILRSDDSGRLRQMTVSHLPGDPKMTVYELRQHE